MGRDGTVDCEFPRLPNQPGRGADAGRQTLSLSQVGLDLHIFHSQDTRRKLLGRRGGRAVARSMDRRNVIETDGLMRQRAWGPVPFSQQRRKQEPRRLAAQFATGVHNRAQSGETRS